MAGIDFGCTNDAASMRRSPAAARASISRTRSATGTGGSFCRPSRGPTSRMSHLTSEFSHVHTGRPPSGRPNLTLGRVAVVVVARRADEIVDIAARLFYERGYQSVSTRSLAQAAGIQGGSLYHHFASKEEILYRIVQYGSGEFFSGLVPHPEARARYYPER